MQPTLSLLAALLLASSVAQAASADRGQRLVMSFDKGKLGTDNSELSGNVVLTQGSRTLRGDTLKLDQTPDGDFRAHVAGGLGLVNFRQALDKPDEFVDGSAELVDYDSRTATVRLAGRATLRHLRGAQVIREVSGPAIAFDERAQLFLMDGGTHRTQPAGRNHVLILPQPARPASPASPETLKLLPSTRLPDTSAQDR